MGCTKTKCGCACSKCKTTTTSKCGTTTSNCNTTTTTVDKNDIISNVFFGGYNTGTQGSDWTPYDIGAIDDKTSEYFVYPGWADSPGLLSGVDSDTSNVNDTEGNKLPMSVIPYTTKITHLSWNFCTVTKPKFDINIIIYVYCGVASDRPTLEAGKTVTYTYKWKTATDAACGYHVLTTPIDILCGTTVRNGVSIGVQGIRTTKVTSAQLAADATLAVGASAKGTFAFGLKLFGAAH
jgi:hypothetical protein